MKKHLWRNKPSCLDAAYERRALEQGLIIRPLFPENNIELYYVGYKKEEQYDFNSDGPTRKTKGS